MEKIELKQDEKGLFLEYDKMILRGDFSEMLPRIRPSNLQGELIVKASRIKGRTDLRAVDLTGGLGEDALLLAASGISVKIFEKNHLIYSLMESAIKTSYEDDILNRSVSLMEAIEGDSIKEIKELEYSPDIILLDPMFPEKQKNSLTKKKLQIIQQIVGPCQDEEELFEAALEAEPKRIIVKRPLKGPYLGGRKPTFSYFGKSVRVDCIVL